MFMETLAIAAGIKLIGDAFTANEQHKQQQIQQHTNRVLRAAQAQIKSIQLESRNAMFDHVDSRCTEMIEHLEEYRNRVRVILGGLEEITGDIERRIELYKRQHPKKAITLQQIRTEHRKEIKRLEKNHIRSSTLQRAFQFHHKRLHSNLVYAPDSLDSMCNRAQTFQLKALEEYCPDMHSLPVSEAKKTTPTKRPRQTTRGMRFVIGDGDKS